jgi:hypothetical protein
MVPRHQDTPIAPPLSDGSSLPADPSNLLVGNTQYTRRAALKLEREGILEHKLWIIILLSIVSGSLAPPKSCDIFVQLKSHQRERW